jgi:hypothetical protein
MLLGPTTAEQLTAPTDPFDDVPAGRWSAGCISYLAGEGIIEGYGDGNFGPEDTLSQAAWLKMLLCAMGYDADKNGMGNTANWATKAQALAVKSGLLESKDLGLDWDRETAVYYAFKAVNINTNLADASNHTKPFIVEIGATDKSAVSSDAFGRPTQEYKATDAKDPYATYVEDPTLTYEDQTVALADIKEALGDKDATFAKVEDGDKTNITNYTQSQAVGTKGSTVEVYTIDADAHQYRIVVINTYAKKLAKDDIKAATESAKAYIQVEGSAEAGRYETADYAEGDVILYTKTVNNSSQVVSIESVEKAESADGKPTGYGSDKAVTFVRIDGEKVYLSGKINDTDSVKKVNSEIAALAEATFYYDTFGNIIFVDNVVTEEKTLDGYVYVKEQTWTAPATGTFDAAVTVSAKSQVVDLATGAVSIIDEAVVQGTGDNAANWYLAKADGTADTGKQITGSRSGTAGYYGYYKLDDGTYVLEQVTATSGDLDKVAAVVPTTVSNSIDIAVKDSTKINNDQALGYADENTVLTYVVLDTPNKVTTVTGIANFPAALKAQSTSTDTKVLVIRDTKTSKITNVYVYNPGTATAQTPEVTTHTYGMYKADGEYDKATDKKSYVFTVNGVDTTYVGAKTLSFTPDSIYEIVLENGEVTQTSALTAETANQSKEVKVITSTYVVIGSDTIVNLADGYQVIDKSTAQKGFVVGATVTIYTVTESEVTKGVFIVVE